MKATWYLVSYDIRDPKRLRRVHAALKPHAVALQQSLHAVWHSEKQLDKLLQQLEKRIDRQQDDIRIWPIRHPGDLWYIGNFEWQGKLRHNAAAKNTAKKAPGVGIGEKIKRLFGANRSET